MTQRFNGEKMTQIVKELGSIPRLVGSEGEIKGINYCKKLFRELDIELDEEPVTCVRGWVGWIQQLLFAAGSILVTLIMIMLIYQPWVNLIVVSVILVLVAAVSPGLMGQSGFKKIGKEYETKNLIQTVKPKEEAEPRQYIILSAHHDTKSQTLSTLMRGLSYIIMFTGLLVLILVVIASVILDLIPSADIPQWMIITGVTFGIISLYGTIPLSLNFLGNKSPGAIDNASGIAVIYEVVRYLKEIGGLENSELVIAIFGAEEVAMWGAHKFCKMHKEEFPPEKSVNINIDMIGYKDEPVEIMETAGIPVRKPVSKFMTGLAKTVANEKNIKIKGFWMPMGAATDGFVLRDVGYDGADFNVFKAALNAHHTVDSIEKWDEKIGIQNCEVISGMIEKLDIHGFSNDFA